MQLTQIKENLESLGYTVSLFDTVNEANAYLAEKIQNTSVGVGGCMTAEEMGLIPILEKNNRIVWHWKPSKEYDSAQLLKLAVSTDIYISSVNAIAQSGEIVNIDGTCNRIASTLYGHKKVYFIAGTNKIAPDFDGAVWRARNVAAPLNARRLGRDTPCAQGELKCHNCKSPQRICKSLNILWQKPGGCDCEIVLINQKLGY